MRTALVERAPDGDEDAFTQLVDLDGDRCYAIANLMPKSAAGGRLRRRQPPSDIKRSAA